MSGRRILVVDDNEDILRLVDEALTMAGYEVTTATCGADAVRKGSLCLPDLVLLDIMMPDADGYQVYERLRAKPSPGLVCPIIFRLPTKTSTTSCSAFARELWTTSPSRSTSASSWPA